MALAISVGAGQLHAYGANLFFSGLILALLRLLTIGANRRLSAGGTGRPSLRWPSVNPDSSKGFAGRALPHIDDRAGLRSTDNVTTSQPAVTNANIKSISLARPTITSEAAAAA